MIYHSKHKPEVGSLVKKDLVPFKPACLKARLRKEVSRSEGAPEGTYDKWSLLFQ